MKYSECKKGQQVIIDNLEGSGFSQGAIVPNQPGTITRVEPDQENELTIQVELTGLKGRHPKGWFRPENLKIV